MSAKLPSQLKRFADRALLSQIENNLELVEAELLEATKHTDPVLQNAARHLVEAGGKRVRPVLVLLTSLLGDGATQRVIDAAAIVELTHLATLYHDDVMDDAPTRHGVPTAQHVFSNSIAIPLSEKVTTAASNRAPVLCASAAGPAGIFANFPKKFTSTPESDKSRSATSATKPFAFNRFASVAITLGSSGKTSIPNDWRYFKNAWKTASGFNLSATVVTPNPKEQ